MQTDEITLSGFLAWAALTRTGVITMPYEEFIESVADVMTEVQDLDREDPTRAA